MAMCFGVPIGHSLYFPKSLRAPYQGRDPADVGFRQILQLESSWVMWHVTGKRLTPAQLDGELHGPQS